MKPLFSTFFVITLSFFVSAQGTRNSIIRTAVISDTISPNLKSLQDSVSYAIGVSVANFYHQQGIKNLNTSLVSKAIQDVFAGKSILLDDKTCNEVLNSFMTKLEEEKIKDILEVGKNFLAENKKRPSVKTTASGLQYEVLLEGTGPKPLTTDSVTCHYVGTFLTGEEFDGSIKRGTPATFALNRVIAGWTEGLQLMGIGSKYKFYIPYNLGYGMYDYNNIPGGSTLIFEIELLGIKKVGM